MNPKNNLKKLLEEAGIKSLIPTDKTLKDNLGGMTIRRFNKILNNSAALTPVTATEANNLTRWVASLTNQPITNVNLFDTVAQEASAK